MPAPHWSHLKERLKSRLPAGAFKMWIDTIEVLIDDDARLILGCPNRFSRQWVEQHFGRDIGMLLSAISGNGVSLEIIVAPMTKKTPPPSEKFSQPELPYQPGRMLQAASGFNQEFTFETFVIGPSNAFAHQAACALASGQGMPMNTLYLQADTGLGKSHLSQAVGLNLIQCEPRKRILYLTAEEFTNQMVAAIRTKSADRFKDRFRRRCDALILEEVHFLSGKEKTQAELAYTLDALTQERKRIIFTSARLPEEIPGLKKELSSRLSAGVLASIDQPDFDTRVKIILAKAARRALELPLPVAETIAQTVTRDVRRLESVLWGVEAKSRLMGLPLTTDLAREVLEAVGHAPRLSLNKVIDAVCRYYDLTPAELSSRSRLKRITLPRMAALYLCRTLTEESLAAISRAFNRKHPTVIYALNRVEKSLKHRDKLGRQVAFLTQRLKELS